MKVAATVAALEFEGDANGHRAGDFGKNLD
jgi:hypothetical protein